MQQSNVNHPKIRKNKIPNKRGEIYSKKHEKSPHLNVEQQTIIYKYFFQKNTKSNILFVFENAHFGYP
jgi:hypothetical protein